jgi:hypothetical protein
MQPALQYKMSAHPGAHPSLRAALALTPIDGPIHSPQVYVVQCHLAIYFVYITWKVLGGCLLKCHHQCVGSQTCGLQLALKSACVWAMPSWRRSACRSGCTHPGSCFRCERCGCARCRAPLRQAAATAPSAMPSCHVSFFRRYCQLVYEVSTLYPYFLCFHPANDSPGDEGSVLHSMTPTLLLCLMLLLHRVCLGTTERFVDASKRDAAAHLACENGTQSG